MKVTGEMCRAAWELVVTESPCCHDEMRLVLEPILAGVPDPYELTSDLVNADRRVAKLEAQLAEVRRLVGKWEVLAEHCQQRAADAYERGDGDLIDAFSAQAQSAIRYAGELRAVLDGKRA